jgi:uncharacterized protein YwqG
MKNKLTDLNDHLFAQLERLGEEGLSDEKVRIEATRSKAMVDIADQIIQNSRIQLEAVQTLITHGERAGHYLRGIVTVKPTTPQLEQPK